MYKTNRRRKHHVDRLSGFPHILNVPLLQAAHQRGGGRRHDHLECPLWHAPHPVCLSAKKKDKKIGKKRNKGESEGGGGGRHDHLECPLWHAPDPVCLSAKKKEKKIEKKRNKGESEGGGGGR